MISRRFMRLVMMFAIMALVACGSPEATPIAEAVPTSTNTAVPTDTAVPPTDTPTTAPTDTPDPTNTAVPTDTPEPTATPTEVPTDTPIPTDTAVPTNTAVPVTKAPAPAAPAAPAPAPAPASGAPPTGPNLITNPGFENGSEPWNVGANISVRFQPASDFAPFVHSGAYSAQFYVTQLVRNVQVGTNYRAGAWVRIWSSDGNDHNVSDNPGGSGVWICINANGDLTEDTIPTTCSQKFQPLDTWQYITVDTVAISDQVRVTIRGGAPRDEKAINVVVLIDDVELGVSPVTAVATATPAPVGRPYPPAPVAFNASAMRDNMNNARSMLEQMGGLLDRLYRGSREACSEYDGYYRSLVGSARYDGVPAEWQGVYNEYIFAVENGSNSNQPIFDLCFEGGGGGVTDLNYGVAREGINNSLNHLLPAIDTANSLLNQ